MPLPSFREPAKRAVEAFFLRDAERVASERTAAQQEEVARYHAGGVARVRAARELRYSDALGALVLFRDAATLFIGAIARAGDPEPSPLPEGAPAIWELFDATPAAARDKPEGWEAARFVLASDDPLAPDGLDPDGLRAAVTAAETAVDWLSGVIEPRSKVELRFARGVHIAAVPLAIIALPILLWWIVFLSRKDLALGMPASASSHRPDSPAAAGVDNGVIEPSYGVHTNIEPNPWVKIDLGESQPIREVRVYNRGDGYESEILPLALQFSEDDKTYMTMAERTEVFTRDQPWISKFENKTARYVRIFMPKEGYIALSEVEVY